MAKEVIDELMAALGLQTDVQSFRQAESSFSSLRRGALQTAGVITGGLGLDQLTRGVAGVNDQLGLTSQQLDVTARDLDSLQFAFERSGGSASDAVSSLRAANDAIDELQLGSSPAFDMASMWNLDVTPLMEASDAMKFMLRLSEQLEGRSTQQQRNILDAFGLGGEGTFELLSGGRNDLEGVLAQAQELSPTMGELVGTSREFNEALSELARSTQGVANIVGAELLPQLTGFADWTSGFLSDNRESIAETISDGPYKSTWNLVKDIFGDVEVRKGQGGGTETLGGGSGDTGMSWLEAIAQTESGGRHRDESGDLITSPTGAEGMYQIIPSTGRDPGYGVMPLQSDSQAEHERFAQDYLGALLREFESEEHATIAYNAGPGNLERWLSESENWREGAAKDLFSGSEHRQFVARQALDYEGKVEGYLGRDLRGGSGGNITQDVRIQVDGAQDPTATAREIERTLRRTADQARQDTANEVY